MTWGYERHLWGRWARHVGLALGIVLAPLVLVPAASTAADLLPPAPGVALPAAVDAAAPYQGQTVCNPVDTPGVTAIRQLLLVTYGPATIGGSRECGTSVSEHYDGRALDWMHTVRDAAQAAQVEAFLAFLLAPAADGTPQEMARRLGIMYLIWNNRMIRMYDPGRGWTEYKGCLSADMSSAGLDTSCHRDHLHISLSWDGAQQRTSWWTGVALGGPGPAGPATTVSPATTVVPANPAPPVVQQVIIPAAAPGRPRAVTAKARKGVILVTWKAPRGADLAQISGYLVAARAGSRSGQVAGTCNATRSARICWLPGLTRGLKYWVAVSATNLAGPSRATLGAVRLP